MMVVDYIFNAWAYLGLIFVLLHWDDHRWDEMELKPPGEIRALFLLWLGPPLCLLAFLGMCLGLEDA